VSEHESIHSELKKLVVETLALEDTTPEEIETDAPLFGDGLGLDSIDALEIAMVLEERYGVTLNDDPEANQQTFESIRSLAAFVVESRAG
jgi:acyl carrier protein